MGDAAHNKTESILRELESFLRSLYLKADREIRKNLSPMVVSLVLEEDGATQRKRLLYARNNGLQRVTDSAASLILPANKKAFEAINNTLDDVYITNWQYFQDTVKSDTGIDVHEPEPDVEDFRNRYDRRAHNRAVDESRQSGEVRNRVERVIKKGEDEAAIILAILSALAACRNSALTTAAVEINRIKNAARWNFGRRARSNGAYMMEIWRHSAFVRAPRDWHVEMDGERIGKDGVFSNGLRYPCDPRGPAKEVINCHCYLDFERGGIDLGSSIYEDSFEIGRSVGAKSRNYDILDQSTGQIFHLVEGSKIKNIEVFAGYGTRTSLHDGVAEGLTNEFGGDINKWQHVKGYGILNMNGEEVLTELHWFQNPTVGKVKWKIIEQFW